MTVRLAAQADSTTTLPCTVRAAAPPAGSSYTALGKLGIRLGDHEHFAPVDSQAALELYTALRGRSPAPGALTPLDATTALLRVRVLSRPHLA